MDIESLSPKKGAGSIVATRANFAEGREVEPFFSDTQLNGKKRNTVKTNRIYLVTIATNLLSISLGTCLSWPSPVGPKLTSQNIKDSPLKNPITMVDMGWISSIHTFGMLMTPFIAASLADKIGRKKVLLLSSICYILGYILLIFGRAFCVILVARIVLGLGIGSTLCTISLYVGEISTDRTRGATISFMPFFVYVGIFSVYCIGPYVSYVMLQYFCLIVPIIFDIVFIFMPESPYYYVATDQREAASKSLQFLRGQDSQSVENELRSIENLVTKSMTEKTSILEIVKTPGSRKALLITVGLFFIQQTSGIIAVLSYTQTIFASAHVNLDAAISAIIVGFVQVTVSGVAPIVVQSFRRKVILRYSILIMGVSQAAFGCFFFAQIILNSTNGITWVPLTAMVLYTIAFGWGFGPVPWAVLSELFPPNTKAFAAAISSYVEFLTGFAVSLIYPILDEFGAFYAFWILSIFCFLGFFFVQFFVIETKDLSFAKIQSKLNKKF